MRRRIVQLTQEQRQELLHCRDHHRLPYMRTKAAAILKVADGQQIKEVAQHGLNAPVSQDTVSDWIDQYEAAGLDGLRVQPGRGRKPAYCSRHADIETAAAELRSIVYRSPWLYELGRSRWWLDGLRQVCSWLRPLTLPGVCQLLKRLGVSYKRGQVQVHSPDKQYIEKLVRILWAIAQCQQDPEHRVFLFEDEHTFHRNPTLASAYAVSGAEASLARLYAGYDSARRIAGCLDVRTGALITMQRNHFPAELFLKFLEYVEQQYPQATTIFIALDNWPVHFAPEVLQALQERQSPIQLLPLPTYAPWTNPIEKVWRKFNQEVAHLHPFSHHWSQLRETVDAWFENLRQGSEDLLRYVGLAHGYNPLKAVFS
jgi:transposase